VVKLLVGLLKGAVIGGGVGYGAFALWRATEFSNAWLTYGLIGLLVGLLVGRPIWVHLKDQNSTMVVALLKAAFGFGVGCGIYALIAKAWGPSPLWVSGYDMFSWPPVLGAAIGGLYGAFVEVDDASGGDDKDGKDGKDGKKPPAKQLKA
jgi:hypothetical protein